MLGQQGNGGLVGPAFNRWGCHAQTQEPALHPDYLFPAGAGLHLDAESHRGTPRLNLQAHRRGRSPNKAVPNRTCVAPSSMATSKS